MSTRALSQPIPRRTFLKSGLVAAATLGSSGVLTACGSSSSSPSTNSPPRHGGTLRAGLVGGTSSDTLDADNSLSYVDYARLLQLYNSPVVFGTDAKIHLSLMDEITPNSTATEWVLRLRPGVTFHNGKDVTAEDVIYTFQRIMDPKSPKPGAAQLPSLEYKNIQKLDTRTVRLPFSSPFSPLLQILGDGYFAIVPVGYDPKAPVGTGPFQFKSFTPGQQSTFVPYKNYWEKGLPYVDELVISDYSDSTSQVNALLSGQLDAIDQLSAASVGTLRSEGKDVIISNTASFVPLTMRVDTPPFNDVRVRQAMRLVADRPKMLDSVFGGYGFIGNDLPAPYDPDYLQLQQRTQDIEMAKSLLKAAGRSGMTVELVTAPVAAGAVEEATVYAEQASAAGITVKLRQVTTTDLFGPQYLKWTFAQDPWTPYYFLTFAVLAFVPGAPYNETHYNDPQFNRLFQEALATVDANRQQELVYEMQRVFWETGGWIIPMFSPAIDAHGSTLHGVAPTKWINLSNFGFMNFWFS
jgi:peptide/nickel transport system substrate-binding protein